jgi:hypothetical protein
MSCIQLKSAVFKISFTMGLTYKICSLHAERLRFLIMRLMRIWLVGSTLWTNMLSDMTPNRRGLSLTSSQPCGALDEFAVFSQDADLAGVLVDVDSNMLHGWPHSLCGYLPRVVVGVIMSPRRWRPAASSNSFMCHKCIVL